MNKSISIPKTSLKRLEYVDVMRGIAISLVVVGHILQFNGLATDNSVFEFIYSFHMPLFFAISGYITQKVTYIDSIERLIIYCKKKMLSIAVPFFVWTIFVNNYILREEWIALKWQSMIQSLMHPGLWFLKTLFMILIAYGLGNYVYNKLCKRNRLYAFLLSSLSIAFVILLIVYCGVEKKNLILFSFFFMGGAVISLFPSMEKLCLSDMVSFFACLCFAILATHWKFDGGLLDDFYKIIISAFCFVALLNFCKKFIMFDRFSKIFQLFGRESLSIYVMQFYLCKFSNLKLQGIDINPLILFLVTFVVAIGICFICSYVSLALKKNSYLGLLFFGKRLPKQTL